MKRILISVAFVLLVGCGEDSPNFVYGISLPNDFSEDYQLSDFNLGDSADYWEIRIGYLTEPGRSEPPFSVISSYDQEAYQALDSVQLELMEQLDSTSGFSSSCVPSYCPIYGVVISGYVTGLIDSRNDLKEFFGDIDTEAELWVWLDFASDYEVSTTPVSYEQVDGGYKVLLDWDSLCGRRGRDLVYVDKDGTIEKLLEVSEETYNGCA